MRAGSGARPALDDRLNPPVIPVSRKPTVSKRRHKRNRRIAARRTPKQATQAICVAYQDGVNRIVGGALLDVTLFGAQLAVDVSLPAGTEVAVGLEAAEEPRPALVMAKVIWCGARADGGYRIGAQFQQPLASAFLQALCEP
jgi:hypothetical protein